MTPVLQTRFGSPDGNCFQACVASVLEIPLEEAADIMDEEDWFAAFQEWLNDMGWFAFSFKGPPFIEGAYSIIGGQSPRGDFGHAVVFLGKTMAHDPHPDGTGIVGDPWDVIYLAPLDPANP